MGTDVLVVRTIGHLLVRKVTANSQETTFQGGPQRVLAGSPGIHAHSGTEDPAGPLCVFNVPTLLSLFPLYFMKFGRKYKKKQSSKSKTWWEIRKT